MFLSKISTGDCILLSLTALCDFLLLSIKIQVRLYVRRRRLILHYEIDVDF